jgi:dihydrofolate synthase/folylpolyglutamate synthase
MNIQSSLDKLFSLHKFGVKLGLENIRNFLDHIGNPQDKLKTIHIAGSNGKGSTSSFIASILQESGFRVGLYTSPHFVTFNERILINGNTISDDYVADFIDKHSNYIDEHELTFFEVTTALAFEYFLFQNVDYAIIETGLGGRLDATNVLNPLACVITSISLEHTNILGDTIENIAYEKSEIIKKDAKVFMGSLPEPAEALIEKKCEEVKSQLFFLGEYIIEKHNEIILYTEELDFEEWEVPLRGRFQKYNAALAALVVAKTFEIDDPAIITSGLKNVVKNTGLQGRYEFVRKNPHILIDSAHNPSGIKWFLEEFKTERNNYKETILLFGTMRDKNIEEMMTELKGVFKKIYITEINYERSASFPQLIDVAQRTNLDVNEISDIETFIKGFLSGDKKNCLVVTGSMYLLGEVKKILAKL